MSDSEDDDEDIDSFRNYNKKPHSKEFQINEEDGGGFEFIFTN
jgi:hypothetical protein